MMLWSHTLDNFILTNWAMKPHIGSDVN